MTPLAQTLKASIRDVESKKYDEDYFLRGKETGKSLYTNYNWMPELTIPMCRAIVDHCGIINGARVLDFGCARGYTVKALRGLGYEAYGADVSEWAIHNCDKEVYHWVATDFLNFPVPDWIIAKDVLEHVRELSVIVELIEVARCGVFAVVPLAHGKWYDVLEYEEDVTHIHRQSLQWWVSHFHRPGWSVEGRYRLDGVKDNYSAYPTGNGFITCRRI